MTKYRCVWIDENNKIQLGTLTGNRDDAEAEMLSKQSQGFSAWLQDQENNRVG